MDASRWMGRPKLNWDLQQTRKAIRKLRTRDTKWR